MPHLVFCWVINDEKCYGFLAFITTHYAPDQCQMQLSNLSAILTVRALSNQICVCKSHRKMNCTIMKLHLFFWRFYYTCYQLSETTYPFQVHRWAGADPS